MKIIDEKIVNSINDEQFTSSICSKYQILSNGEYIDNCPNSNPYYSFEFNILTNGYSKTRIKPPKYLFNKKS